MPQLRFLGLWEKKTAEARSRSGMRGGLWELWLGGVEVLKWDKPSRRRWRDHGSTRGWLRRHAEECLQIRGIGEVTAWALLCEPPEPGTMEKGQAAHLPGVAPLCKQSGKHDGPRYIQGGRSRPRRVFHMAAISASQHNPVLRAFYARLAARGKARKVALVAVMRKFVELINKIFADPSFPLAA